LIHRDLKPSNVLVNTQDNQPHAKIIDFGIAKAMSQRLTEKTLLTDVRQLIGTPQYMSPEHAEGSPDIDTRSDVYSLGVMLYELLTGSPPFDPRELDSKAYGEIQRIIREVDPPRPSTRLGTMGQTLPTVAAARATEPRRLGNLLRGELDWIVMKCLEKERSRRYESAAALAADVLHYLADEPVAASAPSRTYRLQKFIRRHRIPVFATIAFALALLAGIIGTTLGLIGQSRQRVRAEQSAAIAEAIYRFQGELLFSVDPSQMRGDSVTVVQVIQTAVKELDAGKLKDQPLVEAGLRETIGGAFRSLGRYTEAEPNLRKALELRRPALPLTDPVIAGNLFELGLVVRQQGHFDQALKLYTEALAIGRQSFPPGDRRLCLLLDNLSEVLCRLGKFPESESAASEGLEIARKYMTANDPDLGDAVCALAVVLHFENKKEQAEQLFREGVEIKRRTQPGNPELALRLDDLGTCLGEQGKFEEAEPLYLEALEIRRKTLPPTHPQLAQNLTNLAVLYQRLRRFPDAERYSREAVDILRRTLEPDNPELGMFLNNYGLSLHKMGKLEEAEPVFAEAWQIVSKMPAGNSYPPIVASNFASLLLARGKAGEAVPLYQKALASLQASSVVEPWKLGIMREGYGRAFTALGRFPEAETELLAAEFILSNDPPQAPGYHARSLDSLVALYQAWDKAEPGKGYDAKAERWKARSPSSQPPSAAVTQPVS
jgi:tetratricopeptide (TPR) repeat protein